MPARLQAVEKAFRVDQEHLAAMDQILFYLLRAKDERGNLLRDVEGRLQPNWNIDKKAAENDGRDREVYGGPRNRLKSTLLRWN
jgi:hypothetical protein